MGYSKPSEIWEDSYSISTAHLRFARIYDLVAHPKIVGPVADLLGSNIVAWGAHFFCKLPNDGKRVPWHQDALYWPITPTRTVTAWLAVDDAEPENANMRFIPRSHLEGPIDYNVTTDKNAVLNLESTDAVSYGEPVDVTLKVGQFSFTQIFCFMVQKPILRVVVVVVFTLRYAAAEVQAFHGWHHKGIVVQGEDKAGNWANHPSLDFPTISGIRMFLSSAQRVCHSGYDLLSKSVA